MLAQFQSIYPTGSLTAELLQIYQGKYIVRSTVQIEGVTRATGMAAAETIEEAEDRSRTRALMVLAIKEEAQTATPQKRSEPQQVITSMQPSLQQNLQVIPHNSLNPPVVEASNYANADVNPTEVSQPPPSQPTPINSTEVAQTSIAPTPEVLSTDDDNNDYYENQDFDRPLPIPTYSEPEFDSPPENTDIMSDNQPELEENPTSISKSKTGTTTKKTSKTTTTKRKKKTEPIDLSDVIAKTDVEMERLGWTPQQGREYLIQTYGKRGRTLLTEEELLDFLKYLESQPSQIDLLETDPLAGF